MALQVPTISPPSPSAGLSGVPSISPNAGGATGVFDTRVVSIAGGFDPGGIRTVQAWLDLSATGTTYRDSSAIYRAMRGPTPSIGDQYPEELSPRAELSPWVILAVAGLAVAYFAFRG